MHIFRVGDRVSICKEFRYMYTQIEGKVIEAYPCFGIKHVTTRYKILLDNCGAPLGLYDYKLTFPDEYLDFLDRIEDRIF